jgi:hypothetical protein
MASHFIALILILVSAYAKAMMDLCSHGKWGRFDPFWDPEISWRRKWRNGDPKFGERFPGSSTVFVFLTDGWHLSQFIFLNSFFGAWALYEWRSALAGRVLFGVIFELVYSKKGKR